MMQNNVQTPDTSSAIGSYKAAWAGYANSEKIRNHAASGGIVTATFDYMLRHQLIDAALVCRSQIKSGKLDYEFLLARNLDDLQRAQSSKYFDIPMLKGLDLIKSFDGRVGVVGLPSQVNAFWRRAAHSEELQQKIAFKISLFCGHNSKAELVEKVLEKHGIQFSEVEQMFFRQGHWRGEMVVMLKNGEEKRMPFQEFSHYQNLHMLSLERCLNCFDHMGYYADLSTGDTWAPEMKKNPIKHSIFLARTELGATVVDGMIKENALQVKPVDRKTVYLSQKRSINYHYAIAARAKIAKKMGFNIKDRTGERPSLRDVCCAAIVLVNHRISKNPKLLRWFMRMPRFLVLGYLLLFKGIANYERKDY